MHPIEPAKKWPIAHVKEESFDVDLSASIDVATLRVEVADLRRLIEEHLDVSRDCVRESPLQVSHENLDWHIILMLDNLIARHHAFKQAIRCEEGLRLVLVSNAGLEEAEVFEARVESATLYIDLDSTEAKRGNCR